jgi:hypothetical protein
VLLKAKLLSFFFSSFDKALISPFLHLAPLSLSHTFLQFCVQFLFFDVQSLLALYFPLELHPYHQGKLCLIEISTFRVLFGLDCFVFILVGWKFDLDFVEIFCIFLGEGGKKNWVFKSFDWCFNVLEDL